MGNLVDLLTAPAKQEEVVNDCIGLIDEEVHAKGGLTGMAVKAAYATVKAVKPGIISSAVKALLPEFASKVEPFYDQWKATAPGQTLEGFLVTRSDDVADALLTVTDAKAEKAESAIVKKAYEKLRPSGRKYVQEAVPGVGRVLDRALRSCSDVSST